MAYENPGAAAGSALEQFLVDRENRARQAKMDAITAERERRLAEQHQMDIDERRQALQERIHTDRVGALAKRLANMRPGDVPDAELVNEVQKYPELAGVFKRNQGLVTQIPQGQEMATLGGQTEPPPQAPGVQPPTDDAGAPLPTQGGPVDLGAGSVRPVSIVRPGGYTYQGDAKQRQQEEDKKALSDFIQTLDPKSAERRALEYELKTGRTAPAGMFRDIAPAGSNVEAIYSQDPRTGEIQQYDPKANKWGTVTEQPPKGAHWVTRQPEPGAAQTEKEKRELGQAQDTLNQLDEAITAAAHYIGPGHGQFSSFEQMMGAGDPTVSALGAKIIAAKVRIDKALSGTARASANSTLLHYWDNLLANKVDPRNMHSAVQAMREILGGTGGGAGGLKILSIEKMPEAQGPTPPRPNSAEPTVKTPPVVSAPQGQSRPSTMEAPRETPQDNVAPVAQPQTRATPVAPPTAPVRVAPILSPHDLQMSPAGMEALKQREGGFVPDAYPDVDHFAIGYGMNTFGGKPVQKGMHVEQAAADAEFERQVRTTYAAQVQRELRVSVTQPMFDALVSLAYNSPKAASALVARLNRGETLSEKDFQRSATVKGQPNKGLQGRRKEEFTQFSAGEQ